MNNAGYGAGRSSQGQAFMVKGGSTGGGSYSQDPAFYQPEEPEAPEGYGTSSAAALPSGKSNSHPSLTDSSQGNLMDPRPLMLVIFIRIHWHRNIFIPSVYRVFQWYRIFTLFAFSYRLGYPS